MSETAQDTADRLATFIKENFTDIDTGPGSVISELLIKLAAAVQNEQYNTIEYLNQGKAITQVLSSTEKTYYPTVDLIASNYNTLRSTGTKVRGKVKVTITDADDYIFNEGFIFIQPSLNLNYVTTVGVRVSPEPSEALGELQVYSENGVYYFLIDVEAENEGPEYQVASGTSFTLEPSAFISNLVKIEAYGNFSSGKAIETDSELLNKIKYNLSHSKLESESGLTKRFSDTFAGFQALSVCGANDAEMTRSKQNALGIATFGKADVYVRSSLGPESLQLFDKTATRLGEDTWRIDISNTEAPGFYRVVSIVPQSTTLYLGGTLVFSPPVFRKTRIPGERNNELYSDSDARFTKYQAASVTFQYTLPVGVTNPIFVVSLLHQPNIKEMQDLLLLDSDRDACADYLVKAVVPCMVSMELTLIKKRATDTYEYLNLGQLKKDIFTYVNTIPFGQDLDASSIVNLCHNYDIKKVEMPIKLTGNILCPDGTTLSISSSDTLAIPYNLSKGVTSKTTLYFIDYYRIVNGVVNPVDNIGLTIA